MTCLRLLLLTMFLTWPQFAAAQGRPGPLRIEITVGVIELLPVAVPTFIS